jgi:hypothetical protein
MVSAAMAFNFGDPAPTPAPGGGTSGSAAAPATTGGVGFTFGASAAAPAAPTFGAAQTAGTAATPAAPAAGGFSFGGNASAPTAPAAGLAFGSAPAPNTTAPAPMATGGAAPTPVAGGFSFSSGAASTAGPSIPPSNATSAVVPEFGTVFPYMKIYHKLEELLPKASESSDEGRLAAQELIDVLQCTPESFGSQLANPQAFVYKAKDVALREKLMTHPHVTLHGQTTGLTPDMLNQIIKLADELRISELDAMALYDEASKPGTRVRLQSLVEESFVEKALTGSIDPLDLGNNVFRAARELYFYERSCALKAIHLLTQSRLEQTIMIVAASDQLLNANLVGNLVGLVREWTRLAEELERELSNASTSSSQNTFGLLRPAPTQKPEETRFAKVLLAFAHSERQVASECLFFLTYHTQCTADEVASLIELVKDLTNGTSETTGLPLLNPILDIPSAFHDPAPATVNPWGAPFTSALPPLREKHPVEWEEELVKEVWKQGGKPQLLQCVSSLVLSVVCALDSRHELIDRDKHAVNFFGKVRSISIVLCVLIGVSHSCCLSRAMHSFRLRATRQHN